MLDNKSVNLKRTVFYFVVVSIAIVSVVYPFLYPPPPSDKNEAARLIIDDRPMPEFSSYEDVVEKKKAFFNYLLPEINRQNDIIRNDRKFVLYIENKVNLGSKITPEELKKIRWLAKQYRVTAKSDTKKILAQLIRKVDVIPVELVLMQAANESAWGTSRFARRGYNFFGLWCFSEGCGFVPKRRNDEAVHEVKKFENLTSAIRTYLRNLNAHPAYKDLRDIRFKLRKNDGEVSAEKLVHGLEKYSERGQDYIDELLEMIRFNRKYMAV